MIHEWNTIRNLNICSQVMGSILDRWTCPPKGWVKLNSDGSVDPVNQVADIGGVAQNDDGSIIFGYTGTVVWQLNFGHYCMGFSYVILCS